MKQHIVTFIVMDDIQVLDLFGPLEAFAAANELSSSQYHWQIAAPDSSACKTESGTKILPDQKWRSVLKTDTLIFVGGKGPRTAEFSKSDRSHLRNLAKGAARVASVCTGTFVMARLGLIEAKKVTTHWRYTVELQEKFPHLTVDSNALFVKDGNYWSSAGITAGIDMALAMITEDCGAAISASVARQLVVYLRRPGNQAQFSEPLIAQSGSVGRFSDVLAWVAENLDRSINVETLANVAGMSSRHFARLFRQETGKTPAQYVEQMRLDHARTLLGEGNGRIHKIALSVGFKNPDSFRRAFERRFALSPTIYREQFSSMETQI